MVLAQGVQLVRNAECLRRRTAINHAGLAELDLVLQSNVTFDDIVTSATGGPGGEDALRLRQIRSSLALNNHFDKLLYLLAFAFAYFAVLGGLPQHPTDCARL